MGPGRRLIGWVSVNRDTTQVRRAEAELHQAQRMEAIGRLASGIAHELNTPVQHIGHNTRFLRDAFDALAQAAARSGALAAEIPAHHQELDRLADELDLPYVLEQAPLAIGRSLEGVERVTELVRAMKEFAHPDRHHQAPADPNRMILATLEVARNEYEYVADVETDLGQLPPVSCVAGDLNQVFLDILVNAAQAIEDVVRPTGGPRAHPHLHPAGGRRGGGGHRRHRRRHPAGPGGQDLRPLLHHQGGGAGHRAGARHRPLAGDAAPGAHRLRVTAG